VHRINDNPFRLYLIRDGDTAAAPVRGLTVERDRWIRVDDAFLVERVSTDIGLGTRVQTDTMTVTQNGTVVSINGRQNYNEGEWDAFLRLPEAELTPGLRWADTLSHQTDGPKGAGLFRVERSYRATGTVDTLGVSGIGVEVSGQMTFHLSIWTDSVAGSYRWFELDGPFSELHVFDPDEGQLVYRGWSMHLTGVGGDFDGNATDTVPAGLRSANDEWRIPEVLARQLVEPLPGSDTTATFRNGQSALFLHTATIQPTELVEGFRRSDGLVGRATVTLTDEGPVSWSITWGGIQRELSTYDLERTGERALTTGQEPLTSPTEYWGVADFGMSAMLGPSLERIPVDGDGIPFAVYRPTANEWTQYLAANRAFGDFRVFILSSGDGSQSALIFGRDGALLYEEVTQGGSQTVRVPIGPGMRSDQLQAALATLNPGN
jgi:hypothetical protein